MKHWPRYWATIASVGLITCAPFAQPPGSSAPMREPTPVSPPFSSHPYDVPAVAEPMVPPGFDGPFGLPGEGGWRAAFSQQTFHHSELTVIYRVEPAWPSSGVGEARCLVRVGLDPAGVPVDVRVEHCAEPFATAAESAVRQWRWAPPPRQEGETGLTRTALAVTFQPPG